MKIPRKYTVFVFFLAICFSVGLGQTVIPHEHDGNVPQTPCPGAMDLTSCMCESILNGHVVECRNITWPELGEFFARFAEMPPPYLEYFIYIYDFQGDGVVDTSEMDTTGRDNFSKLYWKSLNIIRAPDLTVFPNLTWAAALEEITMEDLPNFFPTGSNFLLPPNLKYLWLDGVDLSRMETWEMDQDNLGHLTHLDVSRYGSLTVTGLPFDNMSSLMALCISDGHLTGLTETSFAGLGGLEILNLTANGLTTLPDLLLRRLIDLKELDVSRNPLTALPSGWLDNSMELREFRARETELEEIPAKLFDFTHQLDLLDLSSNHIQHLPQKIFKNISKLSHLNLTHNKLTEISDGDFEGLDNVTVLDLSHNQLSSLPARVFRGLNRVEMLNLSGNHINQITRGAFVDLHAIERLDLSWNKLSVLRDGSFFGMKNTLSYLDLRGNKIRVVERGTFNDLNVTQLILDGNSFLCSCQNIWLKDFLTDTTYCVDLRYITVHNIADLTEDTCAPDEGSRFITTRQEALFFAGSILFLATIIIGVAIACVLGQQASARRPFFPKAYYDPDNFVGSSDVEIKTISTAL